MKLKALLFSILLLGYGKTQVEYLAAINDNLNGHFNDSEPFYFTSNQIFSVFNNKLYHINTSQKHRNLVELPNSNLFVLSACAQHDGIYLVAGNNSSAVRPAVFKVDNDLKMSAIYVSSHTFGNASSFISRIDDFLYFHLKESNSHNIYRYNLITSETELVQQFGDVSNLTLINKTDNYILFITSSNFLQNVYKIDTNGIEEIFTQVSSVGFSESNELQLLGLKDDQNKFSYYKYNEQNSNFEFVFKDHTEHRIFYRIIPFGQNFLLSNNSFSNDHFLTQIFGDSIVINESPIGIKSEYLVFPTFHQRFFSIAENHPIFSFGNKALGGELYTFDAQDSLTLISDFNPGSLGSFAFSTCDPNAYNEIDRPVSFSYNGKDYAVLTNGNDPHYYLYEITPNGYTSRLRIRDYQATMRFWPTEEFLYYWTYDRVFLQAKLFRVHWNDMNDMQPDEPDFLNESWATQIAYVRNNKICNYSSLGMKPLSVDCDKDGNIFVSLQNGIFLSELQNNEVVETKNKHDLDSKVAHTIAKYNPKGALQWIKGIGSIVKHSWVEDQTFVDGNGDLHVFSFFWKTGYFDNDSLVTYGNTRFYAKLDGNSGEIVSKKVLFETTFTDALEFYGGVLGDDDHFYIAGNYSHFSQNFGDTTLYSQFNNQNYLSKYDMQGNLIWARNVNNSWVDLVGQIKKIEFHKSENEISVYATQNVTSGCNNVPWQGELIFYDLDGNEKRRKILNGAYVHNGGTMEITKNNSLLMAGSFKGKLEAGVYEMHTVQEDNCFKDAGYILNLDLSQNKFISAQYAVSNSISFTNSLSDDDYVYLIGTNTGNSKLTIVRFNHEGQYRGEKELNQSPQSYQIALDRGNFVLAMNNANNDSELNITHSFFPRSNSYNRVLLTITRFKINDWSYSSSYLPLDIKFVDENLGIYAFPNPTYDKIQFNFQDDNHQFEQYFICDASGRVIKEGIIPNQNFMILSTDYLEPGLYHAVLRGEKIKSTIKFIKQH